MEEILEDFGVDIEISGSTITLTYSHHNFFGTCVYEQVSTKGKNKPIQQTFLVLTSTDMGDVIEYINKKSPLTSDDFFTLDKLIRDHSLKIVGKHLSIGSLSNPLEYKK